MYEEAPELNSARTFMLSQQLKPWNINNKKVLDVISNTPRHIFFSKEQKDHVYADTELPIGHEQFCLAPKVIGRILQSVDISPEDKILEIGTGSGYLTCLLAQLGFMVTSFDIEKDFISKTQKALASMRLSDFHLVCGDFFQCMKDIDKKYDVIVFTGAMPCILPSFFDFLNDNGRIFAILGQKPVMHATLWHKQNKDNIDKTVVFETVVPKLTCITHTEPFIL